MQDYEEEEEEEEDEEEDDEEEDDGGMGEGEESNQGSGDGNEAYEEDDAEVRLRLQMFSRLVPALIHLQSRLHILFLTFSTWLILLLC